MFSRLSARFAAYWYCGIPLLAAALLVAGCGASTDVSTTSGSAATPTATLASAATPTPSQAAPSILSSEQFTCPETPAGPDKTIVGSLILLTVAYPSSWKETHCTRTRFSDGSVTLWVGNYVRIDAVPNTTMTVRQWVDAHKTTYETITLQPVTVRQAQEAVAVTDQLDQSAPSPADFYFAQVHALLRGSRYLYLLSSSLDVEYQDTSVDTVIPGPLRDYISDWSVS
jgi:hypothetical protein